MFAYRITQDSQRYPLTETFRIAYYESQREKYASSVGSDQPLEQTILCCMSFEAVHLAPSVYLIRGLI